MRRDISGFDPFSPGAIAERLDWAGFAGNLAPVIRGNLVGGSGGQA